MSEPKERPILFSAEMVRAILAGRKTQTRRIIKQQPPENHCVDRCYYSSTGWAWSEMKNGRSWGCRCYDEVRCPYGRPGDRLWVRETFLEFEPTHRIGGRRFAYRADSRSLEDEEARLEYVKLGWPYQWKPSIHMPRQASRILLDVKAVRVEKLQDISESDAQAEGASECMTLPGDFGSFIGSFRNLWSQINGYDSWDENPWVWVVEFERVV